MKVIEREKHKWTLAPGEEIKAQVDTCASSEIARASARVHPSIPELVSQGYKTNPLPTTKPKPADRKIAGLRWLYLPVRSISQDLKKQID